MLDCHSQSAVLCERPSGWIDEKSCKAATKAVGWNQRQLWFPLAGIGRNKTAKIGTGGHKQLFREGDCEQTSGWRGRMGDGDAKFDRWTRASPTLKDPRSILGVQGHRASSTDEEAASNR
ncbi:hypothetical protein TWF696_002798 [Orbilia brochopaga]|uniref:Uncharacterized protein n=1 Tax=Orbilia brochopaga TaxID=3140254 RepID=A0AAV9U0U9_9PEZI